MRVTVNDIQYHVNLCGEGYPLVLLHGFTGDATTWRPYCELWGKHSNLLMIDIIGHGKTESPEEPDRYQMDKVVEDLQDLLRQLNIDKADILGYSMGGRLALCFAVKYPEMVRKLVLESTSPGLKTEVERNERTQKDQYLAEFLSQKGIHEFVDFWEKLPLFQSHQNLPSIEKESMKKQRLSNSATGLANSLIGMGTGVQPSMWDELERLTCEVLLVNGDGDEKFCRIAEDMQKKLKYSKWLKVENCGHNIHVEQTEKFGTIVSGFLSK